MYRFLLLSDGGLARPDWALGLLSGLGGLAGSYLGARLQPLLPERGLRIVLGLLAAGLALTYIVKGLRA